MNARYRKSCVCLPAFFTSFTCLHASLLFFILLCVYLPVGPWYSSACVPGPVLTLGHSVLVDVAGAHVSTLKRAHLVHVSTEQKGRGSAVTSMQMLECVNDEEGGCMWRWWWWPGHSPTLCMVWARGVFSKPAACALFLAWESWLCVLWTCGKCFSSASTRVCEGSVWKVCGLLWSRF